MNTKADDFPWISELEKTVIQSLTTSFGLDFLLFQDKEGGDVDTIHNVRSGVYATEQEKKRYESREEYNSDAYHKHTEYINTGKKDKQKQQSEKLKDAYGNNNFAQNDNRDLDHVQSAKEIHDDKGRVLAELSGVELANQKTNLKSTTSTVNRSKKELPIEEFLAVLPERIKNHEKTLARNEDRLAKMPRDTPEQQHKVREIENKIKKEKEKIETLKSVDSKKMRKADKESREEYNQKINKAYYTSSKFLGNTATASASAGLRMGARQMLGLIAAEIWFELREQLPKIIDYLKQKFEFEAFLVKMQDVLNGIWKRIRSRFNDFLISFKDGAFAGIFASLTTTIFNIFATTSKSAIKIVREMWGQLVKAFKLFFFNPENLSSTDLTKAVLAILSAGVATIIGSLIYAQLVPVLSFPFGAELAAFISALITGIATLGLSYLLLHSPFMQKAWNFMERSAHLYTLKQFQSINVQLDEYLNELARIEFNLDADELENFSSELIACNSEIERSLLLRQEIEKREIELPFEMGNTSSTRQWLSTLAKKE